MTPPANESSPPVTLARRPIRWWPAGLIVIGACLRLAWLWRNPELSRQQQVMQTGGALLITLGLLVLWVMALSRLRWRTRWALLGGTVGTILLAAALLRYEGVTGDLVPILQPRWAPRAPAGTVAAPAAPPTAPSTTPAGAPAPTVAGSADPDLSREFPQFLGPGRDGVLRGRRLRADWRAAPPVLLWRQPMGAGWGGFAIVGPRAITQEQHATEETVTCYDLTTGRRVWEHRDPARYDDPIGGIGPRATPTIVGDRVFSLGATGWLNCLDLATGQVRWSTNVVADVAAKDLGWGLSSSPLVLGTRVIVAPLGARECSLLALDADTGAPVWSGGTASPHYSSPRLEILRGVPQLLTFTSQAAAAHDPATGALLWSYPWRGGHPHVADPRVTDADRGHVLISSGYGTGSHLVEVTRDPDGRWSATNTLWRSIRLKSKFANLILHDGHAYGLDDGRLACLDLRDGSRTWDGERYGHGQLLLVENHLLITAEDGTVALVDADPTAFRERTRFAAVTGKTWNPPALAQDILIVRNDREAAAYRLPTESP